MEHANSSEVFNPAFNFPAKDDPAASTAQLLPISAPATAHAADHGASGWPEADAPAVSPNDLGRRRASLPAVSYSGARAEQSLRAPVILSRIQSLPEADPEAGASSRNSSVDQHMVNTPGLSIDAHLGTLKAVSTAPSSVKRVEFKRTKPMFSAIEKFLGFDVVTREEIFKIFVTGTLAGCGVAAMRESWR